MDGEVEKPKKHSKKMNMLERGHCLRGHPIDDASDVLTYFNKSTGRDKYQCVVCVSERTASKRSGSRRLMLKRRLREQREARHPRYVHLSCGHTPIFSAVYPLPDDLILCLRCDDYRPVASVGDFVTPPEGEGSADRKD